MMYAINRTEDTLLHHSALVIFEGGATVPPTASLPRSNNRRNISIFPVWRLVGWLAVRLRQKKKHIISFGGCVQPVQADRHSRGPQSGKWGWGTGPPNPYNGQCFCIQDQEQELSSRRADHSQGSIDLWAVVLPGAWKGGWGEGRM